MRKLRALFKRRPFFTCLLAAAVFMTVFSGAQSSRAALTVVSDNYNARLETDTEIHVALLENGTAVSDSAGENTSKVLLKDMVAEGERFHPGQNYAETLTVQNTGKIDEYVRVVVYKYWKDPEGNKITTLDPELIQIGFAAEDGSVMTVGGDDWIVDSDASTEECTVLYYRRSLAVGESTSAFMDTLRISQDLIDRIARTVTTKTENGRTYTTVTASYPYEGMSFALEIEVDCVQTHNAAAAIRSAWGAKLTADEATESLSLQ